MTTTQKRGRKPINQELKKLPITLFIKSKDIATLGGEKQIKENLTLYITTKLQIHEAHSKGNLLPTI